MIAKDVTTVQRLTIDCKVNQGHGGGLDPEVHPAPVDALVAGFHSLYHQPARTLFSLEEPSTLKGLVI